MKSLKSVKIKPEAYLEPLKNISDGGFLKSR